MDINVNTDNICEDDESKYNNSGYCSSCKHVGKGKVEPCLSCSNGWAELGFNYWESK